MSALATNNPLAVMNAAAGALKHAGAKRQGVDQVIAARAAVSELAETAQGIRDALDNDGFVSVAQHERLRAALAPFEVTP